VAVVMTLPWPSTEAPARISAAFLAVVGARACRDDLDPDKGRYHRVPGTVEGHRSGQAGILYAIGQRVDVSRQHRQAEQHARARGDQADLPVDMVRDQHVPGPVDGDRESGIRDLYPELGTQRSTAITGERDQPVARDRLDVAAGHRPPVERP
jgi:hypothetical protein